jgi:hypothetical protein
MIIGGGKRERNGHYPREPRGLVPTKKKPHQPGED